jgi:outer membrane protein assembly factor BamB
VNFSEGDRMIQTPPSDLIWFARIGAIVGLFFVDSILSAQGPPAKNLNHGVPDYTKVTGFIPNSSLPIAQPSVLWNAVTETVDGRGKRTSHALTDAVIADGTLYFGDEQGGVHALQLKDQSELWNHPHGSRVSTPSVDQDFVYFGSASGLTALRRDSGLVAWDHGVALGAGESIPIPVGDHVFKSAYDGFVYCLERSTGAEVWKHNFVEDAPPDQKGFDGARARFQNIVARPNGATCDGNLYILSVFDQSRVIAVDCMTGKRRWTFQASGWISPAPTIANDRVYVASQDQHLYCLDLATGNLVWKYNTGKWCASRAAVYEGRVYLPHHGGKLFQFNAESGELIRTFEPDNESDCKGLVYSFPIIANETAYFAAGNGTLFAVSIETGQLRWKLNPAEGSELFTDPISDGRTIFVTSRTSHEKTGAHAILALGTEE